MAGEVGARPARPVDAFYTPSELARELAEAMPADVQGRVFDPSVGEGALLAAVGARFGDAVQLLGLDSDQRVVRAVQSRQPHWIISRADATSVRSRRVARAWRLASQEVSAVVLNPPFSYRGNGGYMVSYGTFSGRVAPAMQFMVEILTNLRPRQGIYAIMPDGALEAERHRELWEVILQSHSLSRVRRLSNSSFRGARVSTTLIRLTPDGRQNNALSIAPVGRHGTMVPTDGACRCVELIRGRVPVHRVPTFDASSNCPFLHTTNLRATASRLVAPASLSDEGPMVIINRIGVLREPTVLNLGRVVLSDCLIALRPKSRSQVDQLQSEICAGARSLSSQYRGTGAKYVTVDAVLRELQALGWHAHHVPAGSGVGTCCCAASEAVACGQA